jgi:UDP-N-acetylmuramate: L-alanyl-gamma-D-glutamyl-meso-diaminopimelate ligase
MHIHILGICGTFMAGLALLAREAGHSVSGCDANVYPPMSTQLQAAGIELLQGYNPKHLQPTPDKVVVGNVMTRGMPIVETMLDQGIPYTSGPQWLSEHILHERWVLAVAGTHGKTTTTSMLAWILDQAGIKTGFLIGGMAGGFGLSARLGSAPFFVVEADEYDTAFFDKRAKFVHYRPRTLILNNLEFDHADIYPDLASIQRQFHHLVRTVPSSGLIITNGLDEHLDGVLVQGCWTPIERFAHGDWEAKACARDGSEFDVYYQAIRQDRVAWSQWGTHNVYNGLAAVAAARHAGIMPSQAIQALNCFPGVKRRLEVRGKVNGISVYDDFAHHPTAITTTLAGLRARVGNQRILAVLEPRSNTMRMGVFKDQLAAALTTADKVFLYQAPELPWSLEGVVTALNGRGQVLTSIETMVAKICSEAQFDDHILIMSNGAFGGIHERLLLALGNSDEGCTAVS